MDFLNNDLVKNAEAKYGSQAEEAAEGFAEKFVGKDTADSAVGALGGFLGIKPDDGSAPAADPSSDDSSN